MKRLLLVSVLLAAVAISSYPRQADAACSRVRNRVREIVTAPARLIQTVRHRRCDFGVTSSHCHASGTNCAHR